MFFYSENWNEKCEIMDKDFCTYGKLRWFGMKYEMPKPPLITNRRHFNSLS